MSKTGSPNLAQDVGVPSPGGVVECKTCGELCARGFSDGDEAKDTQNLLVHEIIAHNRTMPELAGVFRAKGAEAKQLFDTAIKQAPTHQKACNLAVMYAFHMRVNKPVVEEVDNDLYSSIIEDMTEGVAEAGSSEITPLKGVGSPGTPPALSQDLNLTDRNANKIEPAESSRKRGEEYFDIEGEQEKEAILNIQAEGLEAGSSEITPPEGAGFHRTPTSPYQGYDFQVTETGVNDVAEIIKSSKRRLVEVEEEHEDILQKVMVETGVQIHLEDDGGSSVTTLSGAEGVGSSSTTPAYSTRVSEELIKCLMCDKSFRKVNLLLTHIKKNHKPSATDEKVVKDPLYSTKMPDLDDPQFYQKFISYYDRNSGAYKRVITNI